MHIKAAAKYGLSRLMILILLADILPYARTPAEALAASDPPEVSFQMTLVPGVNNPAPVYSGNSPSAAGDRVFLAWPMDRVNGSSYTNGTYTLTYPLGNGAIAVFTVTKTGGSTASAAFDVETWDEPSQAYLRRTDLAATYRVHTDAGAKGGPNFIPAGGYMAGYNGTDPDYAVTGALWPSFAFKTGYGFSFQYYNITAHFLWNASDNQLYFVTDHIVPGNITDFVLRFDGLGGQPPLVFGKKVMTGVSRDTFNSVPFANSRNTAPGPALVLDPDLGPGGYLDMVTPLDAHPGSPVNELEIRFDIPRIYADDAVNGIHGFAPLGPSFGALPVTLDAGDNLGHKFQIKIPDILTLGTKAAPTPVQINPSDSGMTAFAYLIGGRVGVNVKGLLPGLILNPLSVTFDAPGIISAASSMQSASVFTFLDYEIVQQAGKYYALVRPYKNYSGEYTLKSGSSPTALADSVAMWSDGSAPLMIPLTINSQNQLEKFYQVVFNPENMGGNLVRETLGSQILYFKAGPNAVSIGLPENFKILPGPRLYPAEDSPDGSRAVLEFSARWDVGDYASLQSLIAQNGGTAVVEYEISGSLTPDPAGASVFARITLTLGPGPDGAVVVSYSDAQGKVTNTAPEILAARTDILNGAAVYTGVAAVSFRADAALAGADFPAGTRPYFLFPNIYYLNARPVSVNGVRADVTASMFDSLTLSDITKASVPPPQNLTAYAPAAASFDVSYVLPGPGVRGFLDGVFPYPLLDASANVYISQDEAYLRDSFMPLNGQYPLAARRADARLVQLPFQDVRVAFSGPSAAPAGGYADARDALRAGMVVSVSDIAVPADALAGLIASGTSLGVTLGFTGMDKNQKYYLCADMVLTFRDNQGNVKMLRASAMSALAAITTAGKPDAPAVNEKIPPAPVLASADVGVDRATLLWDRIEPATDGEIIEYEIIRLANRRMDENSLNTRLPFGDFYDSLGDADKAGWRTDGVNLEIYDGAGFTAANPDLYAYRPAGPLGGPAALTDMTLGANRIYFYYARTVRIVNGARVASVWSRLSLTTTPVREPVNLTLERERGGYDAKTEMWIGFDAPVSDLDSLGARYDLQFQLKEDKNDWPEPASMDAERLRALAGPSVLDGYHRFLYKLTGLKPNTLYTVRVRMADVSGDASVYSNAEQFRTGFDQAGYDKERAGGEWADYLNERLTGLLKEPYWVARDDGTAFEAVYRPSMFGELLRESPDAAVTLAAVGAPAGSYVYYIPASAVARANEAEKGFRIRLPGVDALFSPKWAHIGLNESVLRVLEYIKKKTDIEDYFIRIRISLTNLPPRSADGMDPLSPLAEVYADAVGSVTDIGDWDDRLLASLNGRVGAMLSGDGEAADILRLAASGADGEALLRAAGRYAGHAEKELSAAVSRELARVLRYSLPLDAFDAPVLLVGKDLPPGSSVGGYQSLGKTWRPVPAEPQGRDFAMSVYAPGAYVFAGRPLVIPGIGNAPGAEDKTRLVAKYNLGDFLGKDAIYPDAYISRRALAGCAARMAGAPGGAEPLSWLGLPADGGDTPARNQEAYFMIMRLYEIRTGTKAGSLMIRDYGAAGGAAGPDGLDGRFRQSLAAAMETGIAGGADMRADGPMTVSEALRVLAKVDNLTL